MILRALIQPFDDEVTISGAIKTTPVASDVQDLGGSLEFNGAEILGTDKPLKGMGTKLMVFAGSTAAASSAATDQIFIEILTGTDGSTATQSVAKFYFTAAELNEGQEIPMPEEKIYRSLKLSVSADADSKFTAGKIRIVWE